MKDKYLRYLLTKIRIPRLLKQKLITFEQAKQFFKEAKIDPIKLNEKLNEIESAKQIFTTKEPEQILTTEEKNEQIISEEKPKKRKRKKGTE